jgi:hypothetical protein
MYIFAGDGCILSCGLTPDQARHNAPRLIDGPMFPQIYPCSAELYALAQAERSASCIPYRIDENGVAVYDGPATPSEY